MRTIGLVEIVRQLPPPARALANTALQIRIWGGFGIGCQYIHGFAIDDPLACTLQPGAWVSFEGPASRQVLGPLELVTADTRYHQVTAEREGHEQIAKIRRLLDAEGIATKSAEDLHAKAVAIYYKLNELYSGFGVADYPQELLKSCFPATMAKKLFKA